MVEGSHGYSIRERVQRAKKTTGQDQHTKGANHYLRYFKALFHNHQPGDAIRTLRCYNIMCKSL